MTVTSPRSPWTWPSTATLGYGRLIALFCLVSLAVGSPVKREAKKSRSADPAKKPSHQRQGDPIPDCPELGHLAVVLRVPEKTAAHLQANPFIQDSLAWTNDTDNSFSRGNLSFENNKLLVLHQGLYFIYSQALFGGTQCPQQNKNLVSLNVMLDSKMENDNVILLRAYKTPCEQLQLSPKNTGSAAMWNRSIFLGAVFQLEKGDKLYVTTTGTEFLRREPGTIYFGAYAF